MTSPEEHQATESSTGSLDAKVALGKTPSSLSQPQYVTLEKYTDAHAADHALDHDVAAIAHELQAEALQPTPTELRSVLRKIDLLMMPMMCCVYTLTFLDKTTTNYAHLLGFQNDLQFSGADYSWLGSIFYFGYLFATPVHGILFQKLPLGRYLAACIILWGTVLALHAAAFNYAGLVVCRLFLGIFEAAVTPGFIMITGRFYRRNEQVSRTAIWFSCNGWAQILGGLVAYGVLMQPSGSLPVWREMFIILGGVTILLGIVVLAFFPSSPETFKLLSHREKLIAVERIRENQTGLHNKKFKWYQLREAFLDPRLYLLFFCILTLDVANGGTSNFGSAIISSLGYNKKITALLGMATGLSEVVAVIIMVLIARWTKTRSIPGIACLLVAILGASMMVGLPASQANAKVAGYAMVMFFAMPTLLLYATLSSSVGGETKKVTFNAVFSLGYAAGNIIGPQTYRASEAPNYPSAKAAMLACLCVGGVFYVALFIYHSIENKRRDRLYPIESAKEQNATQELSDLTDWERKSFRYPL
ncbi:MFS general substrate transporter [Tilletiaria anomala UBC 951]|uniref:MFS general substrate transporter n=1 Tax=Tilletiaria anomala (strain ATCC 24038 / CBS 436.72 / UBC 951) TaxID=1037660 RepID=A0A066W383_TILAU|nr:MFS general substrate transporter [Tilletiaria anomala UBC 951]KDN47008.1 MFS general substrate transporter [Tilletiaria anomala UBC 951]